tara:strand:- start:225 stop:527 length:303 start_codon:yes stop_codon:yes gene_type:complete
MKVVKKMKIFKKIIIYTAIAFLLLVISGDALVIKMNGLTTMNLIRMLIWAGLIVILLYIDGGWFAKKNGDEVKYSKTKANIILIVSSAVIILIFGFLALQ